MISIFQTQWKKNSLPKTIQFFLPSFSTQASFPPGFRIAGSSLYPFLHLQTPPLHSLFLPVHVVAGSHAENRERFRKRNNLSETMQFFLPASSSTQASFPPGFSISASSLNPFLHLQTPPLHSFFSPVHVVAGLHAENRERFKKERIWLRHCNFSYLHLLLHQFCLKNLKHSCFYR